MTDPEINIESIKQDVQDNASAYAVSAGKMVAKAIVGHSIRFAVSGAITAIVPVESKKDKLRVAVASYALSGLVSDKAKEYVVEDIDNKIEFCKKVLNVMREREEARQAAEADGPVVHDISTL